MITMQHALWGGICDAGSSSRVATGRTPPPRNLREQSLCIVMREDSGASSDALLMTLGAGTETLGRAVRYVASHEGTTHEHPGLYV